MKDEYVLNLDAPDPLAPLADYSEPHARDLALMVAFTHSLFTDATIEELCGTSALGSRLEKVRCGVGWRGSRANVARNGGMAGRSGERDRGVSPSCSPF